MKLIDVPEFRIPEGNQPPVVYHLFDTMDEARAFCAKPQGRWLGEPMERPWGADVFARTSIIDHRAKPTQPASNPLAKAETNKVIFLSTGHLTGTAAGFILNDEDRDHPFPGLLMWGDYGWMFNTLVETTESEHQHPELVVILTYARELGATHVVFDRDVAPIDTLPSYEW